MTIIKSTGSAARAACLLLCGMLCGTLVACQDSDKTAPPNVDAKGAAHKVVRTDSLEQEVGVVLDKLMRDLQEEASGLSDLERARVDEWQRRIDEAKINLSEQIAKSPEHQKQWTARMTSKLEEIESGARDLLHELESR